jgi:RimJ/RimL family protein N-acetyltransferase
VAAIITRRPLPCRVAPRSGTLAADNANGPERMATIQPATFERDHGVRLTVRCAVAADAAAVLAIMDEAVAEGSSTLAEPDERRTSLDDQGRAILDHTAAAGDLFLVAEVGGVVAGWLEFESGRLRRVTHRGEFSVFVGSRWRGQGIGTALLETLLAWAQAHPTIEKVALATFSTNTRAIALYRRMGFVDEGRCPRDMKVRPGEYIDSVLMYQFV